MSNILALQVFFHRDVKTCIHLRTVKDSFLYGSSLPRTFTQPHVGMVGVEPTSTGF